jgi:hypothetical protein
MNLNKLIVTNNDCYKSGRTLTPKGVMVHSTGANNPKLSRYVGPDDGRLGKNPLGNHWNQARPEGRNICCHAFIGKLADDSVATYQILPWTIRGWHCASGPQGSGNDSLIGFEICEDDLKNKAYFQAVYQEAVELCIYLCKLFKLGADSIMDHSEGYRQGIASNHGDVGIWFSRHGKSMDMFRSAVRKGLNGAEVPMQSAPKPVPGPMERPLQLGDKVHIKPSAQSYYPGGPGIKAFTQNGVTFTINKLGPMGGVPCARLAEISTWCALEHLTAE